MDDDLNTADAVSAIFGLISTINTAVKDGATKGFAERCLALLTELAGVLGLLRDAEEDAVDAVDANVAALVEERERARQSKNFARADEIRELLKERGITLKDTPQGVQIVRERQ
jgi:cysteinyl-tRNA synthetase